MSTFVALLRGINVGGNRKIRMADLRELFTEAGCGDVASYIQSGNVVFTHPSSDEAALTRELEQRIERATGFEVPVILRTDEELQDVLDANPFGDVEHRTLHVVFLASKPTAKAAKEFDAGRFAPEEYAVVGREVFMHLPGGIGKAKLPPALPLIRGSGTARNWRTVQTLAEMTHAVAAQASADLRAAPSARPSGGGRA
jgi:uncharacterized protein (DUF1697 family)